MSVASAPITDGMLGPRRRLLPSISYFPLEEPLLMKVLVLAAVVGVSRGTGVCAEPIDAMCLFGLWEGSRELPFAVKSS